jgi:hypothetical protein
MGRLHGKQLSALELEHLSKGLPQGLPTNLAKLLGNNPIIGVSLSLRNEDDESGLGAELQWMNADQMISEATETYPGITAAMRGYVPIGMCLEGSGDPYFWRVSDGAIVRIPHDAAKRNILDESRIELVAESAERLIELAEIT